jgi:hypothetical protein
MAPNDCIGGNAKSDKIFVGNIYKTVDDRYDFRFKFDMVVEHAGPNVYVKNKSRAFGASYGSFLYDVDSGDEPFYSLDFGKRVSSIFGRDLVTNKSENENIFTEDPDYQLMY